ncbi:hypothetical protein BDV25DRAFT_138753 [Aspergillus avenaceus]|uniref:Uncharacterized protein n=1 Tax=Aspergillus avenaceus TaxID=36643 RepID=A0A5N6TYR3_ASPAV|nr:hypothetical protein BDV25DRAFT_138753 [Aspergillus avenaceus]
MSQNINVTQDVHIDPLFLQAFNYADKASTLKLEDWVSLLTLCFSPLIAHILSGIPTVVRRCPNAPSWLDTLCLYNPTTILWRYLAIADRRARFRHNWNAADMSASNAVFWTSRGFDGSEEMMWQSRAFCARVPPRSHTKLWSTDSIKTLITTLQGIQAFAVLIRGILALAGIGNQPFSATIAMNSIFYPLSVFGLLRLFAAPWLTEEYSYTEHESYETATPPVPQSTDPLLSQQTSRGADNSGANMEQGLPGHKAFHDSSMTIVDQSPVMHVPQNRFPLSVVLRTAYVVLIIAILAISVCYVIPYEGAQQLLLLPVSSSSLWLLAAVYILFSFITIVLFVVYLIRCGHRTTTVIPCIGSWWYRGYSLIFLASVIAMIVLSGIFTRRTACGQLTVFPPEFDQQVCNGIPLQPDRGVGPVGFLTVSPGLNPETWVMPLDGWCSGTLTGDIYPVVPVS